jgi:N-acetylmuramoyl-L-alanine amidase
MVACVGRGPVPSTRASPSTPARPVEAPSPASTTSSPRLEDGELPVPRPRIVWRPIPFPDSRKQEMLAYAWEHYGVRTFELVHPRVVVEHFTATTTFDSAYRTFALDAPHLGELPGTCAHFLIDVDGTVYQLVPLDLMCRHTVGLNQTAIGIEMVGTSERQILGDPAELDAALDLTLWLMQRFHIELRNVIGHNESLTSPLRTELVPALRCQTHQDWTHPAMEVFRGDLARRAEGFGLPLGPPAGPVDIGC